MVDPHESVAEVSVTKEDDNAGDIDGITIVIEDANPVPVEFFALTKKVLLPDNPVTL